MAKRFKDNDEISLGDLSNDGAIPVTRESNDTDYWVRISTLASRIKAIIGNATGSISGLMSSTDKSKLDGFVDTTSANRYLTTDGSGNKQWEEKPTLASGDMTKSVYDSNNDGIVNRSDTTTQIHGTPGNDKVYTTDGSGNQQWENKSSVNAGTATAIYGTPGNDKVYTTSASGNQQWENKASITVGNSNSFANQIGKEWSGQTTNATPTEIFIGGVSNSRLTIPTNALYSLVIRISAFKSDFTTAGQFIRQVLIRNVSGTPVIVGSIQTVGTDINPSTLGGIGLTADAGNVSLKVEVTGRSSETWNWKAHSEITQI